MKGKKEKGGEKGGREERRWRVGRERKEGDQEKGEETCVGLLWLPEQRAADRMA